MLLHRRRAGPDQQQCDRKFLCAFSRRAALAEMNVKRKGIWFCANFFLCVFLLSSFFCVCLAFNLLQTSVFIFSPLRFPTIIDSSLIISTMDRKRMRRPTISNWAINLECEILSYAFFVFSWQYECEARANKTTRTIIFGRCARKSEWERERIWIFRLWLLLKDNSSRFVLRLSTLHLIWSMRGERRKKAISRLKWIRCEWSNLSIIHNH